MLCILKGMKGIPVPIEREYLLSCITYMYLNLAGLLSPLNNYLVLHYTILHNRIIPQPGINWYIQECLLRRGHGGGGGGGAASHSLLLTNFLCVYTFKKSRKSKLQL